MSLPYLPLPFIYPWCITCHELSPLRHIVHSFYTGYTAFTPSRGYHPAITILSRPTHRSFAISQPSFAISHSLRLRSYTTNQQPGATHEPQANPSSKNCRTFIRKHALLNRCGASHPPCWPSCRCLYQTWPSTPSHQEGGSAIRDGSVRDTRYIIDLDPSTNAIAVVSPNVTCLPRPISPS